MSDEDAKNYFEEFQTQMSEIDTFGIFVNNAAATLPMFIPGFGIAWGSYVAWETGRSVQAIITINPDLAIIHPLNLIFMSTYGLMEIIAYAIAMSRSFLLIWTVINIFNNKAIQPNVSGSRMKLINISRQQMYLIMAEIGAVITLLLAGSYIEHMMM